MHIWSFILALGLSTAGAAAVLRSALPVQAKEGM